MLFIINGKSKRLNAVQLEIEKTRSNYPDLQIHISVSKRSGDCFRIANSELNNYEAFIACGGDGTFNEVLNGLYFSKNPPPKYIGLLPTGSANDFVKSIGRRSVDQMLQNLKNNHAKPMDIGLLSRAGRTRVFANAASNGIGGLVFCKVDTKRGTMPPRLNYTLAIL